MSDEDWVLDEADRQEGDSGGVEGLKERYWIRFLKGMVTDCNTSSNTSIRRRPWQISAV
jgi:hypothetical protein